MKTEPEAFEARIAEEHRQLAPLFEETLVALESRDVHAANDAIDCLLSIVEAHLAQEDHVYYPALNRLFPWAREPLARFSAFHRRFLDDLEAWTSTVRGGTLTIASEQLRELRESFVRHEVHEEEFLRRIQTGR